MPGSIVVDSSSSTAILASGNSSIQGSAIQEVGGAGASGRASFSPAPTHLSTGVADPFLGLAIPDNDASRGAVSVSGSASMTINPGVYDSISISGNGKLTMNPGIYIIKGGGFTVSGNGSISGSGVMIYNAGSNFPAAGGAFGSIPFGGNGNISRFIRVCSG